MYKIYNNEIKILQLIKGGSELIPSGDKVYNKECPLFDTDSPQFPGENEDPLNLDDKSIDFDLVPPFFDVSIDFHNFNEEMLTAIILTLLIFRYYSDKKDDNNRVKLLKLAIGNLKEIGLFDHYKNDFIEFSTFVNNIISKEVFKKLFDQEKAEKEVQIKDPYPAAYYFLKILTFEDGNIKNLLKKGGFRPSLNFEKNITVYLSNISILKYSLKTFYDEYKALYKENKDSIDTTKIYFRQVFNVPLVKYKVNKRFIPFPLFSGGNYDQLQYILNGGSINTIVRIPKLSEYFKSQLKFIENKLRINNKKLSENSRRDINQIIDGLDKHENNLRNKFELLKSAYLIDRDTINIQDKEQQKLMEEAKKSLNKHKRYSGRFGDLINTLEKIANKDNEKKKPLDRFFAKE